MLYRITVRRLKLCNGVRLEPGMSVEVVVNGYANPVWSNDGQIAVDAFMRVYGVDLRKARALNAFDLNVEKIGKLILCFTESQ